MFTQTHLDRFTRMAGPEFSWAGVPGCARPGSGAKGKPRPRVGLRFYLFGAQGHVCAYCGQGMAWEAEGLDSVEVNHIVSGGPDRSAPRGWVIGNLFAGHKRCNMTAAAEGQVIAVETLARPDLVVTQSPYPTIGRFARHDPEAV